MATRARKAVFALVPLLVVLGAAELLQRLSDWRKARRPREGQWDLPTLRTTGGTPLGRERAGIGWELDPHLLWRNRPLQRSERGTINAQGFRGPDWTREKAPGKQRVFLLGGSVAYGWGVAGDEGTVAARMERMLGPGFEVLNAGVIGYASTQELILLETVLLDWSPDAIVVLDGWNDLIYAGKTPPGAPIRPVTFAQVEQVLDRGQDGLGAALRLSALWRGVERRWREAAEARAAEETRDVGVFHDHPDGPRVYRRNLELIARIARSYGIRAVLAAQPELSLRRRPIPPELAAKVERDTGRGYLEFARTFYPRYRDAAREVAAQHGAAWVDAGAALDAIVADEETFTDACHLTAAGNEALARALADALRP